MKPVKCVHCGELIKLEKEKVAYYKCKPYHSSCLNYFKVKKRDKSNVSDFWKKMDERRNTAKEKKKRNKAYPYKKVRGRRKDEIK